MPEIYKTEINQQIIKQNQMIGRFELRRKPFEELNWLQWYELLNMDHFYKMQQNFNNLKIRQSIITGTPVDKIGDDMIGFMPRNVPGKSRNTKSYRYHC